MRPVDRERLGPGLLEVTKNEVFVGTATGPVRLGRVKARQQGDGRCRLGPWRARSPTGADAGVGHEPLAGRAPEDVDEICGGLPETWFGTSWGDVPTWLVPLRQKGDKGRGFVLYRKPHTDCGRPRRPGRSTTTSW